MEKRKVQVPLVCHGHSRPIVDLSYSPITPDGFFLVSASKGILCVPPYHYSSKQVLDVRAVWLRRHELRIQCRKPFLLSSDSADPASPAICLYSLEGRKGRLRLCDVRGCGSLTLMASIPHKFVLSSSVRHASYFLRRTSLVTRCYVDVASWD